MADQSDFGPTIVDMNVGLTNSIVIDGFNTDLLNTFTDIADILAEHCGPHSYFAMIPNSLSSADTEPTFTKDGINIVRALEFANPLQTYIKRILAYMGSRIESAGGDGTTSAMIICATALRYLFAHLSALKLDCDVVYTFDTLERAYGRFISILADYANTHDIGHAEQVTDPAIIYNIAYCQAYTSSHGNADLADAIAQLYSKIPKMAWNYIYLDKAAYESDRRYSVQEDENQYTVDNVQIMPRTAMSEELGSSCVRSNITTIITPRTPLVGDIDTESLLKTIVTAIDSNTPLAIICPNDMDNATLQHLNNLFKAHKDHQVVLFMVNIRDGVLNDITCMKALANNYDMCTKRDLDIVYNGKTLFINKLYDNPDNSTVHPYYNNPMYGDYMALVNRLDTIIRNLKAEVANRNINQQLLDMQKYRLKLTVAKRACFRIGGTAYDAAANTDVAIDAMLATKHTLTSGFVAGGNLTLLYTVRQLISDISQLEPTEQNDTDDLLLIFAHMFETAIERVWEANLCNAGLRYDTLEDISSTDATYDLITNKTSIALSQLTKPISADVIRTAPCIIQPKNVDIELVKRFGELALKLVKMRRIIVPGGMCSGVQN